MGVRRRHAIDSAWETAAARPSLPPLASLSHHGGRLADAAARFPAAPTPWIDLSTGVNPRPYPAPSPAREAASRLPDPTQMADLEEAAAGAFGLSTADGVAAVPGSETALRVLARLLAAKTVAIAGPTYGSHAEAWRAAGVAVQSIACRDLASAEADVLVAVNPNNPDGYGYAPDTLLRLAARQRARGRWLIVDEAFAEAAPHGSVAAHAGGGAGPTSGLIVLRSFGKFYGLAGLRLGFVVAERGVIADLRAVFGDWPVSAAAIAAGRVAYRDEAWRERMTASLIRKAARLDALLSRGGFEIVGGTSLYRLCAADDAPRRFVRLAEHGILTRPFDAQPRWLRFGLPSGEAAWTRLRHGLEIGE